MAMILANLITRASFPRIVLFRGLVNDMLFIEASWTVTQVTRLPFNIATGLCHVGNYVY